jgi:hypothetical protein
MRQNLKTHTNVTSRERMMKSFLVVCSVAELKKVPMSLLDWDLKSSLHKSFLFNFSTDFIIIYSVKNYKGSWTEYAQKEGLKVE